MSSDGQVIKIAVDQVLWAQGSIGPTLGQGQDVEKTVTKLLTTLTNDERKGVVDLFPLLPVTFFDSRNRDVALDRQVYISRSLLDPGTTISDQVANSSEAAAELKAKLSKKDGGAIIDLRPGPNTKYLE